MQEINRVCCLPSEIPTVVQPEDKQHAGQEDNSYGDFSSAFSGLLTRKANLEAHCKHWNGFLTWLSIVNGFFFSLYFCAYLNQMK